MAQVRSLSSPPDASLVVAVVSLITLVPLVPLPVAQVAAAAVAVLTLLAWRGRRREAFALGLFCVVVLALVLVGIHYSQVTLAAGLLVYVQATRSVPWLHGAGGWFQRGRLGREVWALMLASVVTAGVALVAWYAVWRPDLTDLVDAYVPALPVGLLVVGGLTFSIVNAAVEEGAYRGVVQGALEATLGVGLVALCLQAVAFGALHMNGFPRGWVGVGLAGIYGVMMGLLRRKSHGMLAPWLGHVLTDVVIASIILVFERPAR
jgi:hypothetical protein